MEALVTSGKLILPQENDVADMEEAGQKLLARLGYERYEISNYAKPGYCCRHNLGYWQDAWYLGLGVAAHSMLPSGQPEVFRIRRANTSSVEEYISAAGNPEICRTVEFISPNDAMFETVMLSLRTVEGLNMTHFSRLYGITLQQRYGNVMTSLINDGLALLEGGQFRLTEKGLSIQNTVLMRFMD